MKARISEPVSDVESKAARASEAALVTFRRKVDDFIPDSKAPDTPVVIYVKPDAYLTVLESIRSELTRRLLGLLPTLST